MQTEVSQAQTRAVKPLTDAGLSQMTKAEAIRINDAIKAGIVTVRSLLLDMRDRHGWVTLGYDSFEEYGKIELGYERGYLHKLARAGRVQRALGLPATGAPIPERHLRPLASLSDEDRRKVWDEATAKAREEGLKLTARMVEEAKAAFAAEQTARAAPVIKEMDKLKQTNARLRMANKVLEEAGTDTNAQARAFADELNRTKAALAQAQAQVEAASKNMPIAPPKVVLKEDPDKDRAIAELTARVQAAEKAQAEAVQREAHSKAMLEKSNLQLIEKTAAMAGVDNQAAFLQVFVAGASDFSRRVRGAILSTQQRPLVPSVEMVHTIETTQDLLAELVDLWRDLRADAGSIDVFDVRQLGTAAG